MPSHGRRLSELREAAGEVSLKTSSSRLLNLKFNVMDCGPLLKVGGSLQTQIFLSISTQ